MTNYYICNKNTNHIVWREQTGWKPLVKTTPECDAQLVRVYSVVASCRLVFTFSLTFNVIIKSQVITMHDRSTLKKTESPP